MTAAHRIYLFLQSGPQPSRAIAAMLGVNRRRLWDYLRCLTARDVIERDPATLGRKDGAYRLTGRAVVLPEGRGKSPGSARGRALGPAASTRRRTGRRRSPLPDPQRMHALERAWPAVARVAAWR